MSLSVVTDLIEQYNSEARRHRESVTLEADPSHTARVEELQQEFLLKVNGRLLWTPGERQAGLRYYRPLTLGEYAVEGAGGPRRRALFAYPYLNYGSGLVEAGPAARHKELGFAIVPVAPDEPAPIQADPYDRGPLVHHSWLLKVALADKDKQACEVTRAATDRFERFAHAMYELMD